MNKNYKRILIIISIIFVIWSVIFIYKSSFIINGTRYFSLFDDAMISMKYADNFVKGKGLVWNRFGPVEGYTNFLWTIIMSVVLLIFNEKTSVLIIQIFGIITVLAIAFTTVKIYKLLENKDAQSIKIGDILVFTGILIYYPLSYWSLMGMETGFVTLILISSVYYSLKYAESKSKKYLLIYTFLLCVAYLTRPDNIYFALISSGIVFTIQALKTKRINIKDIFLLYGIYFSVILLHTGFRFFYYGDIIPNTVTLKVFGFSTIFRIHNGLRYIEEYILTTTFFILLATFSVIRSKDWKGSYMFILFIATLCYQIFVGGDPWYYWRMMVPVFPLLLVLAIDGLNVLVNNRETIFKNKIVFNILIIFIFFSGFFIVNKDFIKEQLLHDRPYQAEYNEDNVKYALLLKEFTVPDSTVGVFWAGAIPYYSNRDGIDFLGKSDKYLAKLEPKLPKVYPAKSMITLPGHNKYDLRYTILKLQPDIIQRADWMDESVYADPKFNYSIIKYKGVIYIVKKESPHINWSILN